MQSFSCKASPHAKCSAKLNKGRRRWQFLFSCLLFIVLGKKYLLVLGVKYIKKPARMNNQVIICNSNILKDFFFY